MTDRRPAPRPNRARILSLTAAAVVVVAAIVVSVAVVVGSGRAPANPQALQAALEPGTDAEAEAWASSVSASAAGLPRLSGTYSGDTLAADDLNPPTNSWFAGTVFNGGGQPAFTGVLSFTPSKDGVSLGLPVPHVTANTIFGSAVPDVDIGIDSDAYSVTSYDALSVTYTYTRSGATVGTLVAAEGWPYLLYTAAVDQSLTLGGVAAPTPIDGGFSTKAGLSTYDVMTSAHLSGSQLTVPGGSRVSVFAEPPTASAADLAALRSGAVPLVSTAVSYSVAGGTASTTYSLNTGSAPTVFAGRPHQEFTGTEPLRAVYPSIYGDLSLQSGTTFTFGVESREATPSLDVSKLTGDEVATLAKQIGLDAGNLRFTATDSYYGGKAVYRAAQLFSLAKSLGIDDVAATLRTAITTELALWLGPEGCVGRSVKCFVFDPLLGGIVGQQPAFGSDEFNDHHFHYGYFLYAAAIMAADDSSLVAEYKPMADLLAADIASPVASASFPQRRSFDDYTGHSWAAGLSPFADGNNQESSSEAVNAWAGLTLWAQISSNAPLATEAQWMLSTEIATAKDYWIDSPVPAGYEHDFVSLNFAGKRDYATFFDPAPAAILGIQLIPMSPSQGYLGSDPARIEKLFAQAVPGESLSEPLVDYLVMYLSLADPVRALGLAEKLTPDQIDNGNSRSYLLAYVMLQGR